MANNHPIKAQKLYEEGYLTSLKSVFTDVNSLWTQRSEATKVAKNWQDLGSSTSIDILQKMTTDLLRCQLSDEPSIVFFPVQLSWLKTTSATVDELLVLETVSSKVKSLPL